MEFFPDVKTENVSRKCDLKKKKLNMRINNKIAYISQDTQAEITGNVLDRVSGENTSHLFLLRSLSGR